VALSEDQKAMLRLLAQREQGYDDIAALTGSSVADVRTKVRDATAALDSGLSQDQRAMLRLLAQREEGYGDIAALTGASVEEVRARVRAALGGLEGEAAAPPPPAPKAAAPEPPPARAEEAERTEKPATPRKTERAAKPPAAKPARPAGGKPASAGLPGGIKLPEDRGVRRALAAGGAVVLVLFLLLVTGVIGGDDDGESGSTGSGESTLADEAGLRGGGQEPTEAVLSAADDSEAKGQALFGRSGQNVVLLLSAEGLRPSPAGQSYTVSLVRSPTQRLPLVAAEATDSGIISGRFQIAPQVLGLLAGGFDEMEVSLVDDDVLRAALAQARKSKKAPDYEGTTVLSGPITGPIVEAGEG
jgi:hypothetical protein